MTDDLIAWLRAQIAEDERVARSGAPGPWTYQDVDSVGGGRICDPTVAIAELHYDTPATVDPRIRRTVLSEEADGTGAHIARFNPAHVLAEVEAKRRILLAHDDAVQQVEIDSSDETRAADLSTLGFVVRALALPYANELGYREEWRP